MMKDGNPRFSIRLDPAIIEALRILGEMKGRSPSELIRDEVVQLLERNGIDYQLRGPLRRGRPRKEVKPPE